METTTYNKKIIGVLLRWISRIAKRKVGALVAVALTLGGAYAGYDHFFHLTDEELAQKQLAAAVVAVSNHMVLPEGDEPVLATVTDAEALIAQQAFFTGAIDGDQLLLFPKSLKAVIYSPSRNKIINAGPIEQSPTTNRPPTEQSSVKSQSGAIGAEAGSRDTLTVEIRNGSGITGRAVAVAQEIGTDADYRVVKTGDAAKTSYTRTVLVALSNESGKKDEINQLAKVVDGTTIAELPDGEASSSADVVVIIGSGANQ